MIRATNWWAYNKSIIVSQLDHMNKAKLIHWSAISIKPPALCSEGHPHYTKITLSCRCMDSNSSKILAAGLLHPLNCKVRSPWIELIFPTHTIDAQLDWDVGDLNPLSSKPCLNIFFEFFSLAKCIMLLKEATAIRECCCHEGGYYATMFR